jgi:hypothetical protein
MASGIHSGIGNVAAGSFFAFMQSLGTRQLVGVIICGTFGAVIGGLGAWAQPYVGPWFSRIFGSIKDAIWTTVGAKDIFSALWKELFGQRQLIALY